MSFYCIILVNKTLFRKRRSLGMSEDQRYGQSREYIETLNQNHLSSRKVEPRHKKSLFANKISSKNKREKLTREIKPRKHNVDLDPKKGNAITAKHKHKRVTKLNVKNRHYTPKNKDTESHNGINVQRKDSSKSHKPRKEPIFKYNRGERHRLWTQDERLAPNIHHLIKKQQSPHHSHRQKLKLQDQHFQEKHESFKYPDIHKLRSHNEHQAQVHKPHHHRLDKKQVSKDNHHKKKHNSRHQLPKEKELSEKELYREEYQGNGNQQNSVQRLLKSEEKELREVIDEHPII